MCYAPRRTLVVCGLCIPISLIYCVGLGNIVEIQVSCSREVQRDVFPIEGANVTVENDTSVNFTFNGIFDSDNDNVVRTGDTAKKPRFNVYSIKTIQGGIIYEKFQQTSEPIGILSGKFSPRALVDFGAASMPLTIETIFPLLYPILETATKTETSSDIGSFSSTVSGTALNLQSSLASSTQFRSAPSPSRTAPSQTATSRSATSQSATSQSSQYTQSQSSQSQSSQSQSSQSQSSQSQSSQSQSSQSQSSQSQSSQSQSPQSQSAQSSQSQISQSHSPQQSPHKLSVGAIVSISLGVVLSTLSLSFGFWYVRRTVSRAKKKRITTAMVNTPFVLQPSPSDVILPQRHQISGFVTREQRDMRIPPRTPPQIKSSNRQPLAIDFSRRDGSSPDVNEEVYVRLHQDGGPARPSASQTQHAIIDVPPIYSTIGIAHVV